MRRPRPDQAMLARVRDLPIDAAYVRTVIEDLTAIGSSPLGFRNAGTPEDAAVAAYVSAQMREIGLSAVAVEDVTVDAWQFRSAQARLGDADAYDGCVFGGAPATGPAGVSGRLVDVGDPTRKRLDKLDLDGTIALADWKHKAISPSAFVRELAQRGVRGVILNCPPVGAFFQSDGALGCFDGHWPADAPPMVMLRKEDAAELRQVAASGEHVVTVTVDVDIERDGRGHNVVGYLEGDEPGPIVVGAHHDAWFRGAFDNTSGVAAMLAIAKAMVASDGRRPRHTICFTSRTGEEYGIVDSSYDWCIGAWRQVDATYPEWGETAPFHLCVEASGHPKLRTIVEAPLELVTWAKRVCRAAESEGWTPTGWRVWPPVAGTEQWPFLVKGVPGVAAYAWEFSFADTDYHTQLDTIDMLDIDILVAQARLDALLILSADQDPDAILDHRARARDLAKVAAKHHHDELAVAAEAHQAAQGRAAFTSVGRELLALDAGTALGYPHQQCAKDLVALDAAIAALDGDRRPAAANALGKVGDHAYAKYLSEPAFQGLTARQAPKSTERSWAAASHITQSPNLWAELATLRDETDARVFGPWVRDSLARAREATRDEMQQRLDAMARAVTPTDHEKGEQL